MYSLPTAIPPATLTGIATPNPRRPTVPSPHNDVFISASDHWEQRPREADQRGTPDTRERPPCVHTIRVTRRSRGPRRPAGPPEVTSGLMSATRAIRELRRQRSTSSVLSNIVYWAQKNFVWWCVGTYRNRTQRSALCAANPGNPAARGCECHSGTSTARRDSACRG